MSGKNRNSIIRRIAAGAGGIEVPADCVDKDFWRLVVRYQFFYSVSGLVVSLLCIIGGILMFFNGVSGGGSWSTDVFGLKINDAAPGVVLFLVGLAIANFTRFDVNVAPKNVEPTQPPQS